MYTIYGSPWGINVFQIRICQSRTKWFYCSILFEFIFCIVQARIQEAWLQKTECLKRTIEIYFFFNINCILFVHAKQSLNNSHVFLRAYTTFGVPGSFLQLKEQKKPAHNFEFLSLIFLLNILCDTMDGKYYPYFS